MIESLKKLWISLSHDVFHLVAEIQNCRAFIYDKRLIEDLKAEISVLNEKISENEELLNQQVSIKSTIAEQQKELEKNQEYENFLKLKAKYEDNT